MTRETARRKIKGFPLSMQSVANEDIENKDYITTELVPLFEMEHGYYQMAVNYKIKLEDGYIYGKAFGIEDFAKMHDMASRGDVFTITYLKKSRIILEIESNNE